MKLLLTLGHNASAILVKDDKVLCGYEEERLSHVKADSSFPVLAMSKILEYYPHARKDVDKIFISHWFWDWDLKENKYYRPKFLKANFPNGQIKTVSRRETHHDLHAKSMWNFCDGDKSGLTIVADGFGNFGECLSIYVNGKLQHRSNEVMASLGLMYQYAVGYLGMKENQDEYKLLGYEQQFPIDERQKLEPYINDAVYEMVEDLMTSINIYSSMENALVAARNMWYGTFNHVDNGKKDKAKIAYFVQTVLEDTMMSIIKSYGIKNIKVTGGVFYNVKLNNAILRYADKFEAHPLAGDQGAALGFIDVRYTDLFWGKREVDHVNYQQYFVEFFCGDMEFGPRALGNTSTLALPTMENVEYINKLNGRDTVMPMAPMVTEEKAKELFKDLDKVGKSKEFMIIAFDYKEMNDHLRGAAHIDKDRGVYTGRIQLIKKGHRLYEFVKKNDGIVINTSLNAHGQPILYNTNDLNIMRDIQSQHQDV